MKLSTAALQHYMDRPWNGSRTLCRTPGTWNRPLQHYSTIWTDHEMVAGHCAEHQEHETVHCSITALYGPTMKWQQYTVPNTRNMKLSTAALQHYMDWPRNGSSTLCQTPGTWNCPLQHYSTICTNHEMVAVHCAKHQEHETVHCNITALYAPTMKW